jgi:hypothetical protein
MEFGNLNNSYIKSMQFNKANNLICGFSYFGDLIL